MIELLVFVGFVLPLALWQFYDLEKAKKETARKRAAAELANASTLQEPAQENSVRESS